MVLYMTVPFYIMAYAFDFTKNNIYPTYSTSDKYYYVVMPKIIKISREEELQDIKALSQFMSSNKNQYHKEIYNYINKK